MELANPFGRWVKREYLIVSLVWVIGFVFYLWILTQHPLIYGIDGPYYLIQVRSLLETGHLVYGDPPLSLLLFTFFTLLFGGDITFGVRVGVALFSALSAVPLYFLVKRITRLEVAGYAAMLANFFSAPHIRMTNDLLKNAVGACFLLFFVYYLHDVTFGERTRKNLLFALFFLFLTGVTHILDFGVALLFLILYLAVAVLLNVNRRLVIKNLGILALSVGVFAAAAVTVFPSFFTDFFKGLSFLQALFAASGEANPILFLLDPRGGGFIMPVLAVGIVLAIYEWKMKKKEAVLSLTVVTAIGLILSLPFVPSEWLWRFLLMEFIPIAFILGYSVSKMERKVAVIIFLIIVIFPIVIQGVEASKHMGPTINEKGYSELVAMRGVLPSDSVVVVEPRLMYWVEYVTELNTVRSPSPTLWQSYEHVLALIQKTPQSTAPPGRTLFDGDVFLLIELPSVLD
jgi:hypothetical protein